MAAAYPAVLGGNLTSTAACATQRPYHPPDYILITECVYNISEEIEIWIGVRVGCW